ncbi:MAG: ABC transporter permease [Bacteroidales bacterium]|jgi:putative ABC transport system permease protein|nr:ABC transporter permease [Bacteroidales bacterium]
MYFRLFRESVLFAYNSVVVNKLRTFLSLFGITIGIFSIISVFTVIDWMGDSIRKSINTMGSNVVYVQKYPWSFDSDINWWDLVSWPSVGLDDYQAIIDKSTRAETVSFGAFENENIKFRNNIAEDAIVGSVTADLDKAVSFEIGSGRYFSPFDYTSGSHVAVMGAEVAERLFDNEDPVGKEVTIAGYKATVIGTIKKEGKGGISLSNVDQVTLVPLNFGRNFMNLRNRFIDAQIMVRARPEVKVQELSDEITMILRASRRLKPAEDSNFSVNRSSMLSQGFDAVFQGINMGGWIIGGFAIIVGGFGIANIMYVSVRERTNIIGIQKALGAKKSFILQQFLTESVVLSVMGGILGLFLIFIATLGINYLYELDMHLTPGNALLAMFISATIGVVAGYAPAYSAARMNPVDAIGFSF